MRTHVLLIVALNFVVTGCPEGRDSHEEEVNAQRSEKESSDTGHMEETGPREAGDLVVPDDLLGKTPRELLAMALSGDGGITYDREGVRAAFFCSKSRGVDEGIRLAASSLVRVHFAARSNPLSDIVEVEGELSLSRGTVADLFRLAKSESGKAEEMLPSDPVVAEARAMVYSSYASWASFAGNMPLGTEEEVANSCQEAIEVINAFLGKFGEVVRENRVEFFKSKMDSHSHEEIRNRRFAEWARENPR